MRIICPRCGTEIFVKARAKVGEGTQKGAALKRLGPNHENILKCLTELGRKATVREVQGWLFRNNIRRFARGDSTVASGQWNYHYVQAILSVLVGHGDIEMSAAKTGFDNRQGLHDAKPVPVYWIKANLEMTS